MSTEKPHLKPKDRPDLGVFSWDDPFLLDSQLEEEERMIRQAAFDFAQDRLAPRVEDFYLNEKADPAIFAEMGEAGRCDLLPCLRC